MRCVVTGGSGFIGSHVVDALVNAGHSVINVDLAPSNRVPLVKADIRDVETLTDVFKRQGQDAVFHIAGVANAREALRDPVKAIEINIAGTVGVLEACRRAEVKRVIFASTVWYYNAVDQSVDLSAVKAGRVRYLDETEPVLPTGGGHVYTTSKIASEFLCHDFHRLYGLDFTILRYGIPYGPRMWPGLALRSFVENAFKGEPITVFGNGSAVRRFVYVEDLADAHVRALDTVAVNQTYNLEGDQDVTIKELAESVARYVPDVTIKYIEEPSRRGELGLSGTTISNKKAKSELGWSPTTEFEDGVKRFVEWFKDAYGF